MRTRVLFAIIVKTLCKNSPVPTEAVRLETTLETGSRVGCAAARRRRFLRCDRVQPRSDADRLTGEISRGLLLSLWRCCAVRAPTLRQMGRSATARPCLDGKSHRALASRPGSAAHNPARVARASVDPLV